MKALGWSGSAALDILSDDRLSLLLGSRQRAFERLATCGPWALSLLAVGARVKFSKDRFAPDDDGEPALIVEGLDEFGGLVDCVAIGLDSGQVASHSGAIWALGMETIYPSFGEPIDVHRTAWDWMRAGGVGLYILDYRRAHLELHSRGIDEVRAGDIAQGQALRRSVDAAACNPKILIPEDTVAVAA